MKHSSFSRTVAIGLLFVGIAVLAQAEGRYQLLKEIPVGGEGGWDCLTVDPAAHRLYVSHATTIVVIDTTTDAVAGKIDGLVGAHDFAIAPNEGRGFASNGRENTVSMVDLGSLNTLARISTGQNPDIVLFEPAQEEIYSFNGKSQTATVITPGTGTVTATIALGGKPEFARADGGRVFVNLENKNEVAV